MSCMLGRQDRGEEGAGGSIPLVVDLGEEDALQRVGREGMAIIARAHSCDSSCCTAAAAINKLGNARRHA